MLKAKVSRYLTDLGEFSDFWIRKIFSTESKMLDINSGKENQGKLQSELLSKTDILHFVDHKSEPARLTACFSLLFTRYIYKSIKDIINNRDGRPILTFVTKKGYWLYRIVYNCLSYIEEVFSNDVYLECFEFWSKLVEVKSDRYFTKTPYIDAYKDRNIIVVDDIIHTGESISQFIDSSWCMEQKIRYIIFAIHYDAMDKILYNYGDRITIDDIYSPNMNLDNETLGELSIRQVALFQALGVPYAIDLPVIKLNTPIYGDRLQKNNESFSSGSIPLSVFDRMCKECNKKGWTFVDTSFFIEPGKEIKSCAFCLISDPIKNNFKNLFQNLTVECSYRQIDEYVDVTFVPFAIMRSVRLDELFSLFNVAFMGTDYKENILKFIHDSFIHNRNKHDKLVFNYFNILVTALYRAMVFYFSLYTAKQFNMLLDFYDISLQIDNSHIAEHWDDCFIKCDVVNKFNDQIKNINEKWSLTFEKIYSANDIQLSNEYWNSKSESNRITLYENLYSIMHKYFIRSHNYPNPDFCSIERLEATMSKMIGKPIDDWSFRNNFTQTILRMLNQSAISNAIRLERSSGYVLRGFRAGENCRLMLPFNQSAIFCALYEYFQCCIESATEATSAVSIYHKNYDQMKRTILNYIFDARLDTYLNVKEVEQFLEYYRNVEPDLYVKNKRYIVDRLYAQATIETMLAKVLQNQIRKLPLQFSAF